MADGEIRLTDRQSAILAAARDGGGRYVLFDADPEREVKRSAAIRLRRLGLLQDDGFYSNPNGGGCLYFRLSKKGEEVARVVGAA